MSKEFNDACEGIMVSTIAIVIGIGALAVSCLMFVGHGMKDLVHYIFPTRKSES